MIDFTSIKDYQRLLIFVLWLSGYFVRIMAHLPFFLSYPVNMRGGGTNPSSHHWNEGVSSKNILVSVRPLTFLWLRRPTFILSLFFFFYIGTKKPLRANSFHGHREPKRNRCYLYETPFLRECTWNTTAISNKAAKKWKVCLSSQSFIIMDGWFVRWL